MSQNLNINPNREVDLEGDVLVNKNYLDSLETKARTVPSPQPSSNKKSTKKHKILLISLSALTTTGLVSTIVLGAKQCSSQPVTPVITKFNINLGTVEHCKVTIEEEKKQAQPNEKVKITVSDVESGYTLVCSSINESQYLFFDENNQAEFTMPACDVKLDVWTMETPPVPPTPTTYHTVLFNVAEGETLIGSGYTIVEEGEYFGWINKPTATKEGETFVCWTDQDGNKISNVHEITENMSVYASFVKETDIVYSYNDVLGYFEITDPYTTNDSIDVIIDTEVAQKLNTPKTVTIAKEDFNFPVYFGSKITEIADGFMNGCTTFNQPITIGKNITKIGKSFLKGCTSFNSTIEINDSVTEIVSSDNEDDGFMYGCSSFNKEIKFPNNLENIPNSFMDGCTAFNQPITIPSSVKNIGKWFLNNCSEFNQNLLLPSNIESIDEDFMFNCDKMTSTISIQFNPQDSFKVTDKTLSTENELAESYITGIKTSGSYGEYFRLYLCQNRDETPFRKISSITTTCFLTFIAGAHGQILDSQVIPVEEGTLWSNITPPKYKAEDGYKFSSWTDFEGHEMLPETVINDDMIITANFVEDLVNIEYYATGPGTISSTTHTQVRKKTLFGSAPKPERTPENKGAFDGFYLNGIKLNDNTLIESDSKIEVRFVDKPIKVILVDKYQKQKIVDHVCNKDFTCVLKKQIKMHKLNLTITCNGKTLRSGEDYKHHSGGIMSSHLWLTIYAKSFDADITIVGNFINE